MSISCGRVRRVLWPDGGPRPAAPEIVAARAHVEQCEACQAFFVEQQQLAGALRARTPLGDAPLDVRERLFATLARVRTSKAIGPSRSMTRVALVVAGALLLAVGIGVGSRQWSEESVLVTALAADHARALSGDGIRSSDRAAVTQWLVTRLSFSLYVPVFPDARLIGARLCLMDGRRGAVVEYELGGREVSYFVIPVEVARAQKDTVPLFEHATRAGYRLVIWREPGLVHAFVGGVPESSLERLARLCVEEMKAAIAIVRAVGETFTTHERGV